MVEEPLGPHVASAKRTGAVGRIDEHFIRERKQLLMQAVVEQTCQFGRGVRLREVWPSYIAKEQRVTGQNRIRLGRFFFIRNHKTDAFGRVTRRVQNPEKNPSDSQLKAILHRNMQKSCASAGSNIDFRAGTSG